MTVVLRSAKILRKVLKTGGDNIIQNPLKDYQQKLMMLHEVLHPKDDIDRLNMSRKEEGRGLASIKICIDGIKEITKRKERLIIATRMSNDNIKTPLDKLGRKTTMWIFLATNYLHMILPAHGKEEENLMREN